MRNHLCSLFLLCRHLALKRFDALLVLGVDFAKLHLFHLDDFSHLGAVFLQSLRLTLAVIARLFNILLDEVASANLKHDLGVVVHAPGNVEGGGERHHYLLTLGAFLEVVEDELGVVELVDSADELTVGLCEDLDLLLDGLGELHELLGSHLGDVDICLLRALLTAHILNFQ